MLAVRYYKKLYALFCVYIQDFEFEGDYKLVAAGGKRSVISGSASAVKTRGDFTAIKEYFILLSSL